MINFNKQYNREDFLDFLGEFLPDDFEVDIKVETGFKPIYGKNFERITAVTELGEVKSLGTMKPLAIYEIKHKSENDPRVSLTKEAFWIMKDKHIRRALMVFSSENSKNYRFSLMTIDLKEDSKNSNRVNQEFSNPRRYSFFLGPDSKTHTPNNFLVKQGKVKDFKDLLLRFNIEVVNKDFYREISECFYKLAGAKIGNKTYKRILDLPSVDKNDYKKYQEFAVRLIGRMIFIWFLKHKKSNINKPLIPSNLVSSQAVDKFSNYYHEVLEKLFFEILNKPEEKRKKGILSDSDSIPFLNGGLFDPHQSDDFYENKPAYNLRIEDDWFRQFFKILELYNFTIDESTPTDIEISVDPEMLGRIFENLLAEINPNTGESARKATGSYYTPRVIVEYMVNQSLKYYLLNKTNIKENKIEKLLSYSESNNELSENEKNNIIQVLDEIKIIDPACGSGAFPMGILQKMLLVLQKVDPQSKKWLSKQLDKIDNEIARKEVEKKLKNENWDYIHKLGIIQNSIYGVDIQPIAVEISKLRFFLSLIVDEKIEDEKENRGIEPLPNLEFKFVSANTLINLPNDKGQEGLFEATEKINELRNLRDKYLKSYGDEKKEIESEFRLTQKEMIDYQKIMSGTGNKTLKLADWNPFSNSSSNWFDSEWMFGVKGFDVVIGNPPYGFRNVLTAEEKKYFRKEENIEFSSGDSAELFCKKCFDILLKNDGFLTFIIPKKSLYGDAWEGLRKEYWNKYCLTFLMDSSKAFENVLLEQNIFGLSKNRQDKKVNVAYLDKTNQIIEFAKIEKDKIFMENYTAQIYKELYPEIFKKISKNRIEEILVEGDLGLAIGTNFFSDKPTKYKLLKGIDIDKWRMKQNRYLKNEGKLKAEELRKFSKSKVICQRLIAHIENPIPHIKITACYDDEGIIITNTLTTFKLDSKIEEKFWLAFLNSNFVSWYAYNFIYSRAIRGMDFYNFYIKQIPIPKKIIEQPEQQKPFIKLVDQILEKKKQNSNADTTDLERKIDEMVYELYGLTEREIGIVENK